MAEDLELVRRSDRAQEVEPAIAGRVPQEFPVATAPARMARRALATADGGARARLAAQRSRGDLRTDSPRVVDRPARQYRPESRRRTVFPRRAQHQVLSLAGLGAGEKSRQVGDGRRTGRDEPAVRTLPREDRAGVDREDRRASAEEVTV